MSTSELRPLDPGDQPALMESLEGSLAENCFLMSQLEVGGAGGFLVLGDRLGSGVYYRPGRLLVPFGPDEAAPCLARALEGLGAGLRYVVGRLSLVDAIWQGLASSALEPTWLRANGLYELTLEDLRAPRDAVPAGGLRRGKLEDLEWFLQASSRMDLEDRGVDPLKEDPEGLARYLGWLLQHGMAYCWDLDGRLYFKAQAASVHQRGALVEGVFTEPEARGRGIARASLDGLARELLARVPRLVLYVNEDNLRAVRLYESVGFRRVGHYRSVLLPRVAVSSS